MNLSALSTVNQCFFRHGPNHHGPNQDTGELGSKGWFIYRDPRGREEVTSHDPSASASLHPHP